MYASVHVHHCSDAGASNTSTNTRASCDALAGCIAPRVGRVGAKTAREVTPGGGTGAGLLGSVRGDPGGSDPPRFPQFTPKQLPIQSKSSE